MPVIYDKSESVYIRCITFIDCPRQQISVDVRNVRVVEYNKLAISQRTQHVIFIIPSQTLNHCTWKRNTEL